jgi:hypothetical protein
MADWQWCELELGMIYAWRQSINNSWGIDCWTCWSHLLINTSHCFGWWVFWSHFWHCSTENTSTLGTLYVLLKIQEKNISSPFFIFTIWGRLIILIYYFHYNNKFRGMLVGMTMGRVWVKYYSLHLHIRNLKKILVLILIPAWVTHFVSVPITYGYLSTHTLWVHTYPIPLPVFLLKINWSNYKISYQFNIIKKN